MLTCLEGDPLVLVVEEGEHHLPRSHTAGMRSIEVLLIAGSEHGDVCL